MSKTTDFKIITPSKNHSMNCVYLLYQFYEEAGIKNIFQFDKGKTEKFVDFLLDSPHGCVFVALVENKLIGIILGLASETYFSNELIATEMAWWVDPDYRGTRAGPELMRNYEDWCKSIGVKVCVMSTYPEVSPSSLVRFYKRSGYEESEVSYRKVLR